MSFGSQRRCKAPDLRSRYGLTAATVAAPDIWAPLATELKAAAWRGWRRLVRTLTGIPRPKAPSRQMPKVIWQTALPNVRRWAYRRSRNRTWKCRDDERGPRSRRGSDQSVRRSCRRDASTRTSATRLLARLRRGAGGEHRTDLCGRAGISRQDGRRQRRCRMRAVSRNVKNFWRIHLPEWAWIL